MTIKYSPSARGFFDTALHRDIPEDAVAVSAKRHAELFSGQAEGHEIVPDSRGRPQLRSLAPDTLEAARNGCVQAIKREAARRINDRMPLWQQINAIRAGRDPGFHDIDAIRQASNLIEGQVADISSIELLAAFPVSAHPLWPSFDGREIDS